MDIGAYTMLLVQSGLGNLASYLAAHVLLCLVPAFFIAGALMALVPKEAVTRYLGRRTVKWISYPAAAVGGFVLAVCSCTIMPLFAGIYRKGAGLGPAMTFLFVGPAINILAITYTGVALGLDLAVARLVLSIVFGIGIGLIMARLFWRDDVQRADEDASLFQQQAGIGGRIWLFMGLLLALLIAGTLQIGPLSRSYLDLHLPIAGTAQLQQLLARWVPFDASRDEEGVTVQGLALIILLVGIGSSAAFGLQRIIEGYNRWTWVALGLTALTLCLAAARFTPLEDALVIGLTGKFFAVGASVAGLFFVGRRLFAGEELRDWLAETWRFIKQIFPLLIGGVFVVGVLRPLIRPEWIEALAGSNTVLGNAAGVLFGVFMYFPTLVEVPVAQLFLSLGMHRGPLLAYLMADPELSLQSILIITAVVGRAKAWTYTSLVAVFSLLAGLTYGAWVNGANPWLLGGGAAALIAVLSLSLLQLGRRPANAVSNIAS